MGQDPDDLDTLKGWFQSRFDPLAGRAQPFDQKRFWASTVPGLHGRRLRRPFGRRELAAAFVSAFLLLGGGFVAGRFLVAGGQAVAGPAARAPAHAAAKQAVASTFTGAKPTSLASLLPPGAREVTLSETVGTASRHIVITAPHDIAVLTSELGRSPALGPGSYNCPAGVSPTTDDVFRFIYRSGRVITVNWLQDGCSWLTVAQGPRARPVSPGIAGRETFSAPSALRSAVDLAFER
jgi:hypothetical protein